MSAHRSTLHYEGSTDGVGYWNSVPPHFREARGLPRTSAQFWGFVGTSRIHGFLVYANLKMNDLSVQASRITARSCRSKLKSYTQFVLANW